MLKFNRIKILLILSFSTVLICQPESSQKNKSYTYVKSNLEFLASDLLEGREATTRGEKLAALFISEELEKYGVIPFGDSGTYFQNFNMIVSGFSEDSKVTFKNDSEVPIIFQNGSEAAYSSRYLPSKTYCNQEFEIIFVGYGIFSEEDNYDSYENINVKGKVVLVLNGTPKQDGEELLSGYTVKKYRWSTAKAELAKENGAVGLIRLPDSDILKYWDYVENRALSKSFKLEEELNSPNSIEHIPNITLNESSAVSLLLNEEQNYEKIIDLVDPKPHVFELKSKVKFDYDIVIEKKPTRNIIGLVEGNNKKFDNEYLTIGAHYDHEGIKNGEIYNGADDNGSGTVTVLEVARRLVLNQKNERPVLVIFHTAEEKGLKGAKYLANNSDFIKDVIVHLNIDMIGRKSQDSIYCIGASKISSELGTLVNDVNLNTSDFILDYSFDDPNDPQRFYYRSDHIHYANKGIPIAFFYDYMNKDYHKPTDTVDRINFDKIVKVADLIYNLTLKISNLDHKLTVDKLSTN